MKVAILHDDGSSEVYDANDCTVAIVISAEDKVNIAHMSPLSSVYCGFPDGRDRDEIGKWCEGLDPREPLEDEPPAALPFKPEEEPAEAGA